MSRGFAKSGLPHDALYFVCGHGLAEIVSLYRMAAFALQEIQFCLCLDALGKAVTRP